MGEEFTPNLPSSVEGEEMKVGKRASLLGRPLAKNIEAGGAFALQRHGINL